MAILNYTTDVPANRTVGEIIGILARKGADSITQTYHEDGRIKAIGFTMILRVAPGPVPIRFVLPANVEGVAAVLKREKPKDWNRPGKAERVAWRIVKDWVEAQIALIESGQAQPAQVFLPYAIDNTNRTMFEVFLESKTKMLT